LFEGERDFGLIKGKTMEKKQKVFLITGFNNWGKSWFIQKMFKKQKFAKHILHKMGKYSFCVESKSNDDLGEEGYKRFVRERLKRLQSTPPYILTAFCPTQEKWNNSINIIDDIYRNADVFILAIKYKWCLHAQLDIETLRGYYSELSNVEVIEIDSKIPEDKLEKIKEVIFSKINNS